MDKKILPAVLLDETVPLLLVEPFHCTFCQSNLPPFIIFSCYDYVWILLWQQKKPSRIGYGPFPNGFRYLFPMMHIRLTA